MRLNQLIMFGQIFKKIRVNVIAFPYATRLCRPMPDRHSTLGLGLGLGQVTRFSQSADKYCLHCWQRAINQRQSLKNTICSMKRTPSATCLLSRYLQTTYIGIRGYAKGKDKKKAEKGKKNIQINDAQLSEIVQIDKLRAQFQKHIDKLQELYFKNLSLRSTTGTIESLAVSFEAKEYILQELAQVVRKDPKTVVINMAVFPQAIPDVIQAIKKSGMNLNPQQDGTTLFIPIPKVTKEHRENLSKNAKVLFVKCRDSIKDVQNKFIKEVKSKDTISKDEAHDAQEQITFLASQYIARAEEILNEKQADLIGN